MRSPRFEQWFADRISHPERDCFEHKDEHEEVELVTYPGITIEVDGRPVKVYQIGDGWCWDLLNTKPEGENE